MSRRGLHRGQVILSDTEEMEEEATDSDSTNMSVDSIQESNEEGSARTGAVDETAEGNSDDEPVPDRDWSPVLERRLVNSQEPRTYATRASTTRQGVPLTPRRRIIEPSRDSDESEPQASSEEIQSRNASPEYSPVSPSYSNNSALSTASLSPIRVFAASPNRSSSSRSPPRLPPRFRGLSRSPSPQLRTLSPQPPLQSRSSIHQPHYQPSSPRPQSPSSLNPSTNQTTNTTIRAEPYVNQASTSTAEASGMSAATGTTTTTAKKDNITTAKQQSGTAVPLDDDEDEGQICSICFETWSNSGSHRLASLKCGHLFGLECIEKWLKGQSRKCPQCNAKATKKDIRVLFAKSLKVLDTSEKDRVQHELEKERESRRRLEVEHAQTKLKYELKAQQVVKLQEDLRRLQNASTGISSSQGQSSSSGAGGGKLRLTMHSGIDIIKDGGCRVMAYNEWLTMLVVSMPSQVAMFQGFGVKKINVLDMKPDRYVPLHQKPIRDLAFNPVKNDLLLSVAMDKVIKLTNICSNTQVASYQAEAPLWSCCWNTDDANQFFVGTATGTVVQYDTRNTSAPVKTIKVAGSGPVVSLCYIPYSCNARFASGGVLVARLQSCSFVELKEEDGAQDHTLPLEGPFTSISLEPTTRHVLVSCRPSQRYPHARHLVCELQRINISTDLTVANYVVSTNIIHAFQGGTTQKVLSRSCTTVHPTQAGNVLICAGDESTQATCIWDLATVSCLQQVRCNETVIDILPITASQQKYLTFLTDKSVKFYKWV